MYLLVEFQRRRLVTAPVVVVPLQAVHPEVGLQLGRAGILGHQALGALQDLFVVTFSFTCWSQFLVTDPGHMSTFLTRGLSRGLSCEGGTHFCSLTISLSSLACKESVSYKISNM